MQGELEGSVRDVLRDDKDIALAYLFGSRASGRAGPLSDVDVAVLLHREFPPDKHSEKQIELINKLMSGLKTNEIDVVILNRAPLSLQNNVIREGKPILGKSGAKTAYENRVFCLYLDFKHVLDEYGDQLFGRIKEGKFGVG